jgi:hypothetical protein
MCKASQKTKVYSYYNFFHPKDHSSPRHSLVRKKEFMPQKENISWVLGSGELKELWLYRGGDKCNGEGEN